MISVFLTVPAHEQERVIAALWEAGTAGVCEKPEGLLAYFEEADPPALSDALLARYHPEVKTEEERDWVAWTQEQWQPFCVGERFYLTPEWSAEDTPPGRLRLTIFPGMAAGTGAHPCTQLCLRALERVVRSPDKVFDVGTGTGILAAAAKLLGARSVVACDIDPEAAAIARRNLSTLADDFGLFAGSPRSAANASFSLVAANLNATTLAQLAGDLRRVLVDDGRLVISGFRSTEADELIGQFGLDVEFREEDSIWACLVLR